MAVRKITKRWLLNNFGLIVVIMIVMVVAVSITMHSFYYSGACQYIESRANAVSAQLDSYASSSAADFTSRIRNLVEEFEFKDKMELMVLDREGRVTLTSSGFLPEYGEMRDVAAARSSGDGTGRFTGLWGRQKILAVTVLDDFGEEDFSGLRYVVSMEAVDRQIAMFILFTVLLAAAILLFVLYTSAYFINSIIVPVGEVSRSARQIAQGDFSVRLDAGSDDEIGELCGSINNMAEELSNSEQIKNDFISSVSHELRTPLTEIRGWGETLLQDGDLPPDTRRKGIRVIIRETERLTQMVEELLDFSRIQGGRMMLDKVSLDGAAELGDAVLMFTERARQEQKRLVYEEPAECAPILADRNRLRQAFINIIDNAIKYSDSGDTVTVKARVSSDAFEVEVSDTGVGISPEDLPKIKDRFYKGHSTRRGSGIGLAVADEIIGMHGGALTLSSEKGVGTTVRISLPLLQSVRKESENDVSMQT